MPHLVRKVELLWLVDASEPAKPTDLNQHLPIDGHSISVQLRHLHRNGYLNRVNDAHASSDCYTWSLTEEGREWLATQGLLPAVEYIDRHAPFADCADTGDPLSILPVFALGDGKRCLPSVAPVALSAPTQRVERSYTSAPIRALSNRLPASPTTRPNGGLLIGDTADAQPVTTARQSTRTSISIPTA